MRPSRIVNRKIPASSGRVSITSFSFQIPAARHWLVAPLGRLTPARRATSRVSWAQS